MDNGEKTLNDVGHFIELEGFRVLLQQKLQHASGVDNMRRPASMYRAQNASYALENNCKKTLLTEKSLMGPDSCSSKTKTFELNLAKLCYYLWIGL